MSRILIDASGRHFVHSGVLIPEDLHAKAKELGIKIGEAATEGIMNKINRMQASA